MRKFWNWVKNEDGHTLFLDGPISETSWFGDEVTPKMFRDELQAGEGPVTVWINSPGGCVFAAAQIYNMLMEYSGSVTVKIDGIAASAASVVAMAGGEVFMSPVSMMMCHNPATIAIGDGVEMLRAKALLDEVKESIINAYELRTQLPREKLSEMMDAETWMNAHKAVELGFADEIMYASPRPATAGAIGSGDTPLVFSRAAVTNSLLRKLPQNAPTRPATAVANGCSVTLLESLEKRLSLLSK